MASMCRTIRRSMIYRFFNRNEDKPALTIGRQSGKSWFMRLLERIAKWFN